MSRSAASGAAKASSAWASVRIQAVSAPDKASNGLISTTDTMSVATDEHLYVTANQLYRQERYQGGQDKRHKPYSLFRVNIGAGPVRLR